MKGDTDLNFQGNILIYQNEKGDTKVDAYFNDSTIWMTQKSISQLYQTSPQNVTLHIKNIYADGELYEEATCKDYLQVQSRGNRNIKRILVLKESNPTPLSHSGKVAEMVPIKHKKAGSCTTRNRPRYTIRR